MKKFFTLMLSVVLVSVAFAQHGKNYKWHKNYEQSRQLSRYDIERRNDMIVKVNYEYDKKIFMVRESRMRLRHKPKEIRRLESERNNRIAMIYAHFDGNKRNPRPHRADGYVMH